MMDLTTQQKVIDEIGDCIIYLADDDSDDQYLLKKAFENFEKKPTIKCFVNGWELLESLEDVVQKNVERLPSIVLLDLNMPSLNGKDTLAKIKGSPLMRHFPVIIYTTSQSMYDVEEAYRLGANAYVVKPGSFEQ